MPQKHHLHLTFIFSFGIPTNLPPSFFFTSCPNFSSFCLHPFSTPLPNTASTNPSIPQTSAPLWRAAASLPFDEGWWRCMSGGIDNIYGAEWEWSIFLSGAVTPLAKLHHGQLPRQTPSSLLPLLLPGAGPHLHGYVEALDTIKIRQSVAKKERQGYHVWLDKKKKYRCDV